MLIIPIHMGSVTWLTQSGPMAVLRRNDYPLCVIEEGTKTQGDQEATQDYTAGHRVRVLVHYCFWSELNSFCTAETEMGGRGRRRRDQREGAGAHINRLQGAQTKHIYINATG